MYILNLSGEAIPSNLCLFNAHHRYVDTSFITMCSTHWLCIDIPSCVSGLLICTWLPKNNASRVKYKYTFFAPLANSHMVRLIYNSYRKYTIITAGYN